MTMQRFLWLIVMIAIAALCGCESQEQTPAQTAPHQVVKPDTPIKTEEVKPPATASEKDSQTVAEAEKIVEEAVAASDAAAEQTTEEVTSVVEQARETVSSEAEMAQKEAEGPVAAAVATGTKAVSEAKETAVPAKVVFDASYGTVTMPHAEHAEAYACTTCHGEATPAAMELGKDAAHSLCKDCHKDAGAGPTGCRGCHIK